jgi:hypothetical protein
MARRWRQDEPAPSCLELHHPINDVGRNAYVQPPCPEPLYGPPFNPDSVAMKEGGGHPAQLPGKSAKYL